MKNSQQRALSRRGFLGLGLLGGAAVALAACSNDSSPETSSDSTGTPQRIVALNTGQLDTLLALGLMPVGIATAAADATASTGVPDFLKEEFGQQFLLDDIEVVGERSNPSVEKIAALEPDLILANQRADSELLERLRALAPVVLSNGGSEKWKEDLGIIADAVGKRAEADSLLADYEQRASDWAEQRGSGGTISLVRSKGSQYVMHGEHSLAGIVARDAGFERPESQTFTDKPNKEISPENFQELEADYLFYSFSGPAAEILDNSLWLNLEVVQQGRAENVDGDPWFLNASIVAAQRVLDDMMGAISQ
ncbi:iron-siderophore ABC transporter substrate-binding protein [Corynebacterium lowii]|uniref:Putative siderophore-binding lipoprotein YfiY n=1 Tax=Corynebacterium lowii TaxID=1544413 RepID=A0A0N8W0S0_9CORY|nr:iron-siderophore ABC transporter substrate-binding protein [Corynebacterium lowii]KQB87474.1 putative siderophore-binding lipoprotein YfiY precursor [Corynebacterium lowii]MDP9851932.1 iron complex transport system substrate-binding protein [Corynebacterium lowii]